MSLRVSLAAVAASRNRVRGRVRAKPITGHSVVTHHSVVADVVSRQRGHTAGAEHQRTRVRAMTVVGNWLVSANQQLKPFYSPGDPIIPPDPVSPLDQNALNFYLQANAGRDAFPPDPISPVDALDAIIGQANITLNLIATHASPGDPIIPQIVIQANHTILVATDLKSCGVDVCGG